MQEAVNIREYLDIFKRRKWIMIILIFVSLILGGYKTYQNYISYKPTYTSTVTVRINTMKEYEEQQAKQKEEEKKKSSKKSSKKSNNNNSSNSTNLSELYNTYSSSIDMRNQNIASSYVGITTKEQFRKKVAAISGKKMSELGSITATQNAEIPTFVDIKVISPSADTAGAVAKASPEAFNQELIEIAKVDCVEVVYEATTPSLIPRGQDRTLIKFLAVGIVASIFLILLAECLDTRIKTPNDVDKYWDLPLIGVIPMDDGKTKGLHEKK